MRQIIQLLIVLSFLACEDGGDIGFQGTKIDKETDSASTNGNTDVDAQAVPPTSISGAWLVCEWIDQSAGRGGCVILDRDGRKLNIDSMTVQYWKIVFRNGGQELQTEFTLQEPASPYHVIFQIMPGQNYQAANIDIVYSQNGSFLTKNLNQVFQQGTNPIIARQGEASYTPLRDLKVPAEKTAGLAEVDRGFFIWPDPEKSAVDAGDNAVAISAEPQGPFDPEPLIFNPAAYCGAGGVIKGQIDSVWKSQLEKSAGSDSGAVKVRPEIVKGTQAIFLPAWEECVLPISTGTQSRTAQSADGSCMFMLVQERSPPQGFSQLQPYLIIFTRRFADAVGFSFADVESAANQFPCL
jgi:hypothetical protein